MCQVHFKAISDHQFDSVALSHPQGNFMQTSTFANFISKMGSDVRLMGVFDDLDNIIGVFVLQIAKGKLGKTLLINYGPLLDLQNREVFKGFINAIKRFAKCLNSYKVIITPYLPLAHFDRTGQIITMGEKNEDTANIVVKNYPEFIDVLQENRLKVQPTVKGYGQIPKFMFIKNIADMDFETLRKTFIGNKKRQLKSHEYYDIEIVKLKKNELDRFVHITGETSTRRGFNDRGIEYYQSLYDCYGDQAMFILAYHKKEQVDLACGLFIFHPNELMYLYSGTDFKYSKFNGPALIQNYMLKIACEKHIPRYNFYGISSNFKDKNDTGAGVFRFKRDYGGFVEELVGTFEIDIDPIKSTLAKIIAKVRG